MKPCHENTFKKSAKPEENRAITKADYPHVFVHGNHSNTAVNVTPESSLSLIAVRSCVDLLAQTIGTLSIHSFRKENDERQKINHPVMKLINEPNESMSRIDWLECLMSRVLLHGNSFDYLDYQGGRPVGIHPLDNKKVKIVRPNGFLKYQVTIGNETREVEPWRILHCKGLTTNGIVGISPIDNAAQTISVGLSMEKMSDKFFKNGQQLGGVLKHPDRLSPEARTHLRDAIHEQHAGIDNAFRLMILQEGMEFSPISISQEAAQFIEQKKVNVLDILRLYHIPSHMMSVTEGSMSFSSVEHMGISFYRNTIRPWLKKLEAEFNRKLWQESEKEDHYVEFDSGSLLRGDQASQDASFKAGLDGGWYSINSVKKKLNMSAIKNGDNHYRPLNHAIVEQDHIKNEETKSIDLSAVIEDAKKRILTKEIKALQRANKKMEPQEFIQYANEFYKDHESIVRDTISPVMQCNGENDSIDTFAETHCRTQLRELSLVAWEGKESINTLLEDWRNNHE